MIRSIGMACLAGALLLPMASGCSALGYAAAVIPGPPMKARYPGLAGQKVAIVVWADRAATYDYPTLHRDVASTVQNNLKSKLAADKGKTEELQGTTFVDPLQVYRWQRNHPEFENRSLNELAPAIAAHTGATRIVYIELSPFSTRDPRTDVLLKGNAGVSIKVAEVNGSSVRIPFEEANAMVVFPTKAPEGVPVTDQMNAQYIYNGLVREVAGEVAMRFFSYSEQ
jgi:hypothetical protein